MIYRYLSTYELRQMLAQYNRVPLTPAVAEDRAEVVRELSYRTQGA